jgi:hypothetical protein
MKAPIAVPTDHPRKGRVIKPSRKGKDRLPCSIEATEKVSSVTPKAIRRRLGSVISLPILCVRGKDISMYRIFIIKVVRVISR